MYQTKKGNQWYFGMNAHFGVDSHSKLIHVVVATPANVADSAILPICCTAKEGIHTGSARCTKRFNHRVPSPAEKFTCPSYTRRSLIQTFAKGPTGNYRIDF